MKEILMTIGLIISYTITLAQSVNPSDGILFPEGEVSRVDLRIDVYDLEFLLSAGNEESIEFKNCFFRFSNSQLTDSLQNVGIRLTGTTSRYAAKKSFQIAFNHFDQNRTFHNASRFNFKAEKNDPTLSREKAVLKIFREENIPAVRSSHIALYINGVYFGLYLNTEEIDRAFLASRFCSKNGILVKGNYGANLINDPNIYCNEEIYQIDQNNHNGRLLLSSLLDSINILTDEQLVCYLESHFDIEQYIKTIAIEHLTGHWDNYSYNKNNFYLYWNDHQKRWTYIPHNLDNTLGIDWIGYDWGRKDLNNWYHTIEARPLISKILGIPNYKNQYNQYISYLITHRFNNEKLDSYFSSQKTLLRPFLQFDIFYTSSYGWTVEDFEYAFSQPIGGHVEYGIKDYISTRVQHAQQQIQVIDVDEIINNTNIKVYPSPKNHQVILKFDEIHFRRCLISLMNLNGKTIKRWSKKPSEVIDISTQNIHHGTYFLSIEVENNQKSWVKLPVKKVVI
ncbi:CotH kinase family protein [Flammeovirga aprica]|uniref:T9SS type A sorting domain-containing protein n=1 Tax=Flammeovirga aprica JL-4 TaxID=694437 RepID=A0A7X9RVQ8_9BACT|nr:CotH kinase family protein [Flammeovirga aprica]NME69519.1 T9SS type A sorting domain-containing protein [Flammeovirga aprica JL-4]